jgi:hypothetical protein
MTGRTYNLNIFSVPLYQIELLELESRGLYRIRIRELCSGGGCVSLIRVASVSSDIIGRLLSCFSAYLN